MPRPRKYDWDDKRDICYKLWVEDRLSATQIVKYFANHFNLPESEIPPHSQFAAHFRKWGFPSHREKMEPEKEERLVARMRELFEQNLQAKHIQARLNDEGWDMDDYHFQKFRLKHGMTFRNEVGYKPLPSNKKRKRTITAADGADEGNARDAGDDSHIEPAEVPADQDAASPAIPPEEVARRAQRLTELEAESDHLLSTRKRRRRIRGFGHLPPDDPNMQPRYGSETSLDECKAFLHLSNEVYSQIREQYEAICRDMGITKMSLCAEGQWQASKDRLVRENAHLSAVLHPLQPDIDQRTNALNCVCMDVTKRMRNMSKTLTIADANNILGIDPLQSKELRRILYDILDADQFTTVLACGKERVEQLCQMWYSKSDILQSAIAEDDPQKKRAIFILSKDARKRYCDDQVRRDPAKRQWQKQKHYGPGPGPAQGVVRVQRGPFKSADEAQQQTLNRTTRASNKATRPSLAASGPAREGREGASWRTSTTADTPSINFDLDPALQNLSYATHGPPWPPTSTTRSVTDATAQSTSPTTASSIPAYFRLSPQSKVIGHHPRMWLGKLTGPNMPALKQAATAKAGAGRVAKVQGVVKNDDASEDSWLIENDDELAVYLDEAGEKATFVVVLEGGYA